MGAWNKVPAVSFRVMGMSPTTYTSPVTVRARISEAYVKIKFFGKFIP